MHLPFAKYLIIIALNVAIILTPFIVLPDTILAYATSIVDDAYLSIQYVTLENSSNGPEAIAFIAVNNPTNLLIELKYLNYTVYSMESMIGYGHTENVILKPLTCTIFETRILITCENSFIQGIIDQVIEKRIRIMTVNIRDIRGRASIHLPIIGEISRDISVEEKTLVVDVASMLERVKTMILNNFRIEGFEFHEDAIEANISVFNPLPVPVNIHDVSILTTIPERNFSFTYSLRHTIHITPSAVNRLPIKLEIPAENVSRMFMKLFENNLRNITKVKELRTRKWENFTVDLKWQATIEVLNYNLKVYGNFSDTFSIDRFIDFKVLNFREYDAHSQEIVINLSYMFNIIPGEKSILSSIVYLLKDNLEITLLNVSGVIVEKVRNATITPFSLLTPIKLKISDMPTESTISVKISIDNETLVNLINAFWSETAFFGGEEYRFTIENFSVLLQLPNQVIKRIKLGKVETFSRTYPFTYIEVIDISNPKVDILNRRATVEVTIFIYNPLEVGVYLRVIDGYSIMIVFRSATYGVVYGKALIPYPKYIPPLSSECLRVRVAMCLTGGLHLISNRKSGIKVQELVANIQIMEILYVIRYYGHKGVYV